MEERSHLHDSEMLLSNAKPSVSVLIVGILVGFFQGLILGIVLCLFLFIWSVIQDSAFPWVIAVTSLLLGAAAGAFFQYRRWAHAHLRVTTERILLEHKKSFFGHGLVTVKWAQYQESSLGHRNPIDVLFGAHPVCIRYGTADTEKTECFPAISYGRDLKHYLDKVDSAVRKNEGHLLRPFVPKPRGERY